MVQYGDQQYCTSFYGQNIYDQDMSDYDIEGELVAVETVLYGMSHVTVAFTAQYLPLMLACSQGSSKFEWS